MKLVRHGAQVAVIQEGWEKAYLLSRQGKQEWVPVYKELVVFGYNESTG